MGVNTEPVEVKTARIIWADEIDCWMCISAFIIHGLYFIYCPFVLLNLSIHHCGVSIYYCMAERCRFVYTCQVLLHRWLMKLHPMRTVSNFKQRTICLSVPICLSVTCISWELLFWYSSHFAHLLVMTWGSAVSNFTQFWLKVQYHSLREVQAECHSHAKVNAIITAVIKSVERLGLQCHSH